MDPTEFPAPPSGNGGYWLVGTYANSKYTWEWLSTLSAIPGRLQYYGYVEPITVTEELHWNQQATVAGQPSPSHLLPPRPYRPPVSEVKGLRKLSWRR